MRKIIAMTLLISMLLFCLASCGGFSEGKYVCEVAGIPFSTMTFEDGTVYSEYRSGKSKSGEYSVSGSKISVSWDDGKSDTFEYDSKSKSFKIAGVDDMVWEKAD